MTKDEAMKLALDALLAATPVKAKDPQMHPVAIVALREALAQPEQPEQEPVDFSYQPDWKEEYQKAVDLHCLTLDELREKNVEIKRLKAMIESQDMVFVRSAARIVDLQTHIENFDGGDR